MHKKVLKMEKSEELSSSLKCLNEDNPEGMITNDNFSDLLKDTISDEKAELVASLIFSAFAKDGDGTIDLPLLSMGG
jgi:Ca2+-binding EF-hand superfamily protein